MTEKTNHTNQTHHGSVISYTFGFLFSLALTFAAYIVTEIHINSLHEVIPHQVLIPTLLVFAVTQLIVQLVFFLHILQEQGARWNLVFFVSTASLILLVVVASIWIMDHLNNNMTPQQMYNYVQSQDSM